MVDDADFCGGSLRLTAFLRVVQNELPHRPARLKRRPLPLIHHIGIREFPPLPITESSHGAEEESTLGNQSLENATLTRPETELMRWPTNQKLSLSSKANSTPGNRKGRLSTKGLAVLRSTTLDGLPDPHDAEIVFAAPITESDPINDFEPTPAKGTEIYAHSQESRDSLHRKPNIKLHTGRPRLIKIPRAIPMAPRREKRTEKQYHFEADGFVGDETTAIPNKRLRNRRQPVIQRPKHIKVFKELALATGTLPSPVLQSQTSFAALNCLDPPRNRMSTCNNESAPEQSPSGESDDNNTVVLKRNQDDHKKKDWIVDNQLSKVTAPIRQDTESDSEVLDSASEDMTQEQYIVNNEMEYPEYVHAFTHLSTWPDTPEFFEASTYFESAMQHLVGAEQDSHDFWTQYNAME